MTSHDQQGAAGVTNTEKQVCHMDTPEHFLSEVFNNRESLWESWSLWWGLWVLVPAVIEDVVDGFQNSAGFTVWSIDHLELIIFLARAHTHTHTQMGAITKASMCVQECAVMWSHWQQKKKSQINTHIQLYYPDSSMINNNTNKRLILLHSGNNNNLKTMWASLQTNSRKLTANIHRGNVTEYIYSSTLPQDTYVVLKGHMDCVRNSILYTTHSVCVLSFNILLSE